MNDIRFFAREPIGSSTYPLPDQPVDIDKTLSTLKAGTNQKKSILYIHVPFCDQICSFCGFTRLIGKESMKDTYVNALIHEIRMYAQLEYIQSLGVSSVFLGGGTANSLSAKHLDTILASIKANFTLDIDCQITCEGTPQNFTEDRIEVLKRHNVSRVSAGIQTFNKEIRTEHLRMNYGKYELLGHIENIRKHFSDFNIDMIYNFPDQTDTIWDDDLNTAIGSGATHLTIYPLVLLEGTAFYSDYVKKQKYPAPDHEREIALFKHTVNTLRNTAYEKYSVNDWAFPQRESRYITLDAESVDVIGLGAVAHGYLGGMVYKNIQSPKEYIDFISRKSCLPISRQRYLSERDKMDRHMVMGLRLDNLDLSSFERTYGRKAQDVYASQIADMCESGYLKLRDDHLVFTDEGLVWANNVRSYFEREKVPCVGYSDTTGIGQSGKDHYGELAIRKA